MGQARRIGKWQGRCGTSLVTVDAHLQRRGSYEGGHRAKRRGGLDGHGQRYVGGVERGALSTAAGGRGVWACRHYLCRVLTCAEGCDAATLKVSAVARGAPGARIGDQVEHHRITRAHLRQQRITQWLSRQRRCREIVRPAFQCQRPGTRRDAERHLGHEPQRHPSVHGRHAHRRHARATAVPTCAL